MFTLLLLLLFEGLKEVTEFLVLLPFILLDQMLPLTGAGLGVEPGELPLAVIQTLDGRLFILGERCVLEFPRSCCCSYS